jgi:hypothetical protein
MRRLLTRRTDLVLLILALSLTLAIYAQGIGGGFIFDDFPNIVDNAAVQPKNASLASLVRAALSSPSSEFKRPLASLTFAANYLFTGSDPGAMKATNIVIHLLNGIACFFLTRLLLTAVPKPSGATSWRPGTIASLVTASWLLLPINVTSVLYVVQRMESLANLAVFMALIGYVKGRQRMRLGHWRGLPLVVASITIAPLLGVLAKETAILVPLYALCIELVIFKGRTAPDDGTPQPDVRIQRVFLWFLAVPFVLGIAWMSFKLANPRVWASRDFTLYTRLLSECRIVADYIVWTLVPQPSDLSFYHDSFVISGGWLRPPSTLLSALCLLALAIGAYLLRRRCPLVALGVALYFACHSLTATIIPLELVYEHRNYFASYGLMLATVPLLLGTRIDGGVAAGEFILVRRVLLGAFIAYCAGQTLMTTVAWGTPLGLATELAERNPNSPRAQYELGRMYIILSDYDPSSPFTARAYAPLERAASLPKSSILPEQALIFLNARMHRPLQDAWWDSMVRKLEVRRPSIQDESALGSLGRCAVNNLCQLPHQRMVEAFLVALSHPNPTARLLAMYADYAWGELGDLPLAYKAIRDATDAAPSEPAYITTRARIALQTGNVADANAQLKRLEELNIGGALDSDIRKLRTSLAGHTKP